MVASVAPSRIRRFNSAITFALASSLEDIVLTSFRSVNAATSVTVPNTLAAATFTLSFVSGLITTETSDWITNSRKAAGVLYLAASIATW
jgi:uncharacterized membrane protein YjfL (UPF0719 family)